MSLPIFRREARLPRVAAERLKKRDAELGSKWARFARRYLRENPFCAECLRRGRDTPAVLVDHIVPRKHDGPMWAKSNLQGLCREHDLGMKRELERLAIASGDVQILITWMTNPCTRPGRHAYVAAEID